jgi:Ca2+-binding RTX toxin-like protein
MKFRMFITLLSLIVITAINFQQGLFAGIFKTSTAYAVGDLVVDWGIGTGSVGPIFTISNMAPGQSQSYTVSIDNNAVSARPVGVKGVKTADSISLSDVMQITISRGAIDLYGGTTGTKTLSQFFNESTNLAGIEAFTLQPNQSSNLTFKVTFASAADNIYQNQSLSFNLKIGIAIQVPAECSGIAFSNEPIFGTSGSDRIRGTNANDLIYGFEGRDTIDATNGDDCIVSGSGNDQIDGSNGNDIILGGSGNDQLNGSNGDDKIWGEEGEDRITGSNGNDQIFGGLGNDRLEGTNGDDLLVGNGGDDQSNGGNGIDTCNSELKTKCEI